MNKLILTIALLIGVATYSEAATITTQVQTGSMTNVLNIINGTVKITQIVVSSATAVTNVSNLQFIDTFTNSFVYTNAAFTNTFEYATNLITVWTNYTGTLNYMTNLATVIGTNSTGGSTNVFPVRLIGTATTNTATIYGGVNYYFNNGLWVTNGGGAVANVTITYQQ